MTCLKRTVSVMLFSLAVCGLAAAGNPTFFAALDAPSGVAATPDRLFATEYCGDHTHVLSIDPAGNNTIFATLPGTGGGCLEKYIAISPGLGGFAPNYIYVTQGTSIIEVSADGSSVRVFATIPTLPPASANGITFDHIGAFNYNMVITGFDGSVYTVDSNGNSKLLANVGTHVEGPAVAPSNFAPYAGQIMVGAEDANTVFAISPSGSVSSVGAWVGAEMVDFVPSQTCEYSSTGAAYFSVVFPDTNGNKGITKFPSSDFSGLNDSAIVTSEKQAGIGLFTSDGSSISVGTFQGDMGDQEGAGFVDCSVPRHEKIVVQPSPTREGRYHRMRVSVLSDPTFNPFKEVNPATVTFGLWNAQQQPIRCRNYPWDVPESHDGIPDFTCQFLIDTAGFQVGNQVVIMRGQLMDGTAFEGSWLLKDLPGR